MSIPEIFVLALAFLVFLIALSLIALFLSAPVLLLLTILFVSVYVGYREAGTAGMVWSALSCLSVLVCLIPVIGAPLYHFVIRRALMRSLRISLTPPLSALDKLYLIVGWIACIVVTVIVVLGAMSLASSAAKVSIEMSRL